PDQVGDQLVGGVRMMQSNAGQLDAAEPTRTVQVRPVDVVLDGEGGADARPARRVDLFDDGVNVLGCLFRRDVAGTGGDGEDIEFGIEQRQGDGESTVDAGIADEDDLS